jgi:hypothetical protein
MDSVLYNQDLFRYVCSYMNDSDMLCMTQINKEINKMISENVPKYYFKKLHLQKLKQKHNFSFLQDCVKSYLQAELLYSSYLLYRHRSRNGFTYATDIENIELKGKVREIYNILRLKQWAKNGHPVTNKIKRKINLLKLT